MKNNKQGLTETTVS